MAKKNSNPPKIEAIRHTEDKRTNIPTEELRDFVAEDERTPKTMLYPRDPSLDPQLVWKGKDEQDGQDLAVPIVPIYIQEKIHPQAMIENLREHSKRLAGDRVAEQMAKYQTELFGDFNGGPHEFDQKIEFYQHEQNWTNRMILGDSLLVMTSLAEKEGLKSRIQTIYLDPPYGIKFGSNWQVSTRKRDVKDGKVEDATRQPEQIKAFRDTWQLGIHSYLSYLRDRLVVARELLTESGSIFVQIGDENVHLVRCVMDEVFGSENFINQIVFQSSSGRLSERLDSVYDIILWYAKNIEQAKIKKIYKPRTAIQVDKSYNFIDDHGRIAKISEFETENGEIQLPVGAKRFKASQVYSQTPSEASVFAYKFQGTEYYPSLGSHWRTNKEGLKRLEWANRLLSQGKYLAFKLYHHDFPYVQLHNIWTETAASLGGTDKIYVVQTNLLVVQRCLLMTTDSGDLVLDPTCGSGTTAYVAEQWGRRWITCDTSRVALALARTRLMSAKYPYYVLASQYPKTSSMQAISDEDMKKYFQTEVPLEHLDVRQGFVYKRVPHVTLKSIANNPDIVEGMTQQEIDAAIARHAETEVLYDQPYEDSKRVRVGGPFSVESLSPHRILAIAEENQDHTVTTQEADDHKDFATIIIENLKKAGVQNTRKNQRLIFTNLDIYPGKWIHAVGEYWEHSTQESIPTAKTSSDQAAKTSSDQAAKTNSVKTSADEVLDDPKAPPRILRRVAVSIGPEHGTVSPYQVKEAAKEAVQGIGFDMLIVCGFAFDPHVSEEVKRYGQLIVLPAKMNPDLAMGDELLKKTGAGNLFLIFGEPDIEIKTGLNQQITIELKGLDVYDPTTGQIRSSSTDDIACWFIDTDYNGESFFVHHAYFTGSDQPYEKLKRTLRAEIDESAWATLYSTVSRPFPKPPSGKIAVKVINHYGDEVLKVFEIA